MHWSALFIEFTCCKCQLPVACTADSPLCDPFVLSDTPKTPFGSELCLGHRHRLIRRLLAPVLALFFFALHFPFTAIVVRPFTQSIASPVGLLRLRFFSV